MARFVVTGQPPDTLGRRAVGPLTNRDAADKAAVRVARQGWTEVWTVELDDQFFTRLAAGGLW